MKRILFTLAVLVAFVSAHSQLPDASKEYVIACYADGRGGITHDPSQTTPLMYNVNASSTQEDALWVIKEERSGAYSIQNVSSGLYISYDASNADAKNIKMISSPSGDVALWTFHKRTSTTQAVYLITSVAAPNLSLDRRNYNPVGTYPTNYGNNEYFYFIEKGAIGGPSAEKEGNGSLFEYLDNFTLNQKTLAFCSDLQLYFYTITPDEMDTTFKRTIRFALLDATHTVRINDQEITNGAQVFFEDVTKDTRVKIEILKDDNVLTTEYLLFTSLPIVQLYSNGNIFTSNFSKGRIRVHDPANTDSPELLNAELRYRGASAQSYPKKAFAIKLRDDNWESIDRKFFDIRDDNYWILDAMAVDNARMRNRVATDLWNDFSAKVHYYNEEPKTVNGTRGQFVEVFIDDVYWGLYCMTDRIDRKQLKLKKLNESTSEIRGVLYKSAQWSYEVMMGYVPDQGPNQSYPIRAYNNYSETWQNYEAKYPELEDGEPFDWGYLHDVVKFVAHESTNSFTSGINTHIDFPVWLDYYLFIDLLLATDNHGKNAYFSMYDVTKEKRLGITPWDLDGVLGIRWDGSYIAPEQYLTEMLISREHGEHNLFRRLRETNAEDFNTRLTDRYAELRRTHFTPENLYKRFSDYLDSFRTSGAADREIDRWQYESWIAIDFSESYFNSIKSWIEQRIAFLDKQYNYVPSNINTPGSTLFVYPNPTGGLLYIKNIVAGTPVYVYNEMGVCLYTGKSESEELNLNLSSYTPGRYYIKAGSSGKVIIKR